MHTAETVARTVSAMEPNASPAADEAGKDLVASVKEEPQDDIKDYAETTMNELLGLYGYDKVSIQDTEHLNLEKYGTADQSPSSSRDDTGTPPLSDHGNDTDDISSICSNPNETALAAQHKNLVSALNSRHANKEDSSTRIICSWCQKSGSKLFTLKSGSGTKAFCSEVCFTQCRRASFKKNKVCDWCKHVRHTVNYVDFQDGEVQLQFCCEKCLNQYKMNIFCRETEEHLSQIQSQIRCPSSGSEDLSTMPVEDNSKHQQILITPDLWLQNQARQDKQKRNDSEEDGIADECSTGSRKAVFKTEPVDSSRSDSVDSRRLSSGRKHRIHDYYDHVDRRSVGEDHQLDGGNDDHVKHRHRSKEKPNRTKARESRTSVSSPNLNPNMMSASHDRTNVTSPLVPPGALYPQWFPPPHMLGSLGGAQMPPFYPMGAQPHPMFYGNIAPKLTPPAQRKASRHSPHPSTPQDMPDGRAAGREGRSEGDYITSTAEQPGASRNPLSMFWRGGMPPMPAAFGCPMVPGLSDRAAPNAGVPGALPGSGPPVTMMLPFPVVLPVPVPIPIPIPLTQEQIMLGVKKMNRNKGIASDGSNSSLESNKDDTSVNNPETKDHTLNSAVTRCDSRASSTSARSFASLSRSPLHREPSSRVSRSTSSPATMETLRDLEEQKAAHLRLISPISSPVVSSDEAIDLSTDKSGQKNCTKLSASYKSRSETNGQTSGPSTVDSLKPALPKIHIVDVKPEPPLSQELPLPKTNHPYNKRRGLILDAPFVPKKPRSPSPERRVYVRNPPRDIYELQARRRCVRAKLRSK